MADQLLTPRWSPLRPHAEQARLWTSPARFKVTAAGRRSGKSERAKRKLVHAALAERELVDLRLVYAAPTRQQVKDIAWGDLKRMVPRWALAGRPNETELSLRLINGAQIQCVGMDVPERIEGPPLDGIVLDEFANMHEDAWGAHIRPALETDGRRPGWAWFIGVPEGRNHFWRLHCEAARREGWASFWWPSSDILSKEAIEEAKRDTDPLTFAQEYEASFVNFAGRAYYTFERAVHAREPLNYSTEAPLDFCFDFNRSPGVAVIMQDQSFRWRGHERADRPDVADEITGIIGEVYIRANSTTPAVCRKLIQDWGQHKGDVRVYGDATGGAKGSAKVAGSDWDLVTAELKPVFGSRLKMRVPDKNPPVRSRVNAVNSRFRSADGKIHALIDPIKAPYAVDDFEAVVVLEGGAGEIDKDADEMATHCSDAGGYRFFRTNPIGGYSTTAEQV